MDESQQELVGVSWLGYFRSEEFISESPYHIYKLLLCQHSIPLQSGWRGCEVRSRRLGQSSQNASTIDPRAVEESGQKVSQKEALKSSCPIPPCWCVPGYDPVTRSKRQKEVKKSKNVEDEARRSFSVAVHVTAAVNACRAVRNISLHT